MRLFARPMALAMASANCYPAGMLSESIRRLLTVLAAMVLAVGLVAHNFGGPDMIAKSAMTAASHMPISGDMPTSGEMPMSGDMPMSGKCNGCAGDEKGLAPAACSAFCSAVFVLPAVTVDLYAVPAEPLKPTTGPDSIGRTVPPDPYPPRPAILS